MASIVTVAIPTLDAGPAFESTLRAIRAQRLPAEVDLLVCDSGSKDTTVGLARAYGARLIEIVREQFSHGGTRNRLMAESHGTHVAFLTQDAVPADLGWLERLIDAFNAAPEVGLAFGPYLPNADASVSVTRELTEWFASFSPAGGLRVDALVPAQRELPEREFLGHRGYFTDANGCVLRAAWERVPFRDVAYAEDHLLAQDMLRAGYAKVFSPAAAVVHSHDYTPWQWLRRSFDEARALQEIYGLVPRSHPPAAARAVTAAVGADLTWARAHPEAHGPAGAGRVATRSLAHHGARATGTVLGAHSAAIPAILRTQLSLEKRR